MAESRPQEIPDAPEPAAARRRGPGRWVAAVVVVVALAGGGYVFYKDAGVDPDVQEQAAHREVAPESEGDSAAAEAPGEETVTMLDVLRDEADLEEDAKAVLGAADAKNCTYLTGGELDFPIGVESDESVSL